MPRTTPFGSSQFPMNSTRTFISNSRRVRHASNFRTASVRAFGGGVRMCRPPPRPAAGPTVRAGDPTPGPGPPRPVAARPPPPPRSATCSRPTRSGPARGPIRPAGPCPTGSACDAVATGVGWAWFSGGPLGAGAARLVPVPAPRCRAGRAGRLAGDEGRRRAVRFDGRSPPFLPIPAHRARSAISHPPPRPRRCAFQAAVGGL